jgi:chromosome partitioning protein
MFDGRTNLARQVEEEVRRHFDTTFSAVVPRSVRLSEAPSHGEPIQRYDPSSPGAAAYNAVAAEILERLAADPPSDQPSITRAGTGGHSEESAHAS